MGHAASGVIGMFPYRGGPKGFEKTRVDVVFVDECFSTDRCCGIIGNANGFGLFDRFCVKKECSVKAHNKTRFIPHKALYFAPGSGGSAFCCHFAYKLCLRSGMKMTSREWIQYFEGRSPERSTSFSITSQTPDCFVVHPSIPKLYALDRIGVEHNMTVSTILQVIAHEKQKANKRGTKRILIVTKDREESRQVSKDLIMHKLCFHHNHFGDVVGFVTVCSYNDLLLLIGMPGKEFHMVIPTDISHLKTTMARSKQKSMLRNYNVFSLLLDCPDLCMLQKILK